MNNLNFNPREIKETFTVKPNVLPGNSESIKEFTSQGGQSSVMPRIEAIHAGATRNHTRYPADKLKGNIELKSGVYSWTEPYPKPVIYNHDVETAATGRIRSASYEDYTQAGRPGIVVVPEITDKDAIQAIADGRLLTVSIGATTDAAICSLCGTDIINEGFCGHMKGEVYDGQTVEWTVGNIWFDELSWVNVPADQDAMVVGDGNAVMTAESFATDGNTVINLGKEKSAWTESAGTPKSSREKGDVTVTEEQIQAMQEELDQAKADLETANKAKEALEAEKETLEGTVQTLESEKATLEQEKSDAETALEEANTSISTLESEKKDLEEALSAEKDLHNAAVEENATLSEKLRNGLVERVVDMRIALGKESDREDAVSRYSERTTESLNDTLSDLLAEPVKQQRQRENVQNPGAGDDLDNKQSTITAEDAFHGLFSGPAFSKHNQ